MLYTNEEVRKLENLMNFGRVQEKAVHCQVNQYCSGDNDCGNYQPSERVGQGFDLRHLEEIVNSPLDWFTGDWQEKIERAEAYIGLLLMLSLVVFLLGKIARKDLPQPWAKEQCLNGYRSAIQDLPAESSGVAIP